MLADETTQKILSVRHIADELRGYTDLTYSESIQIAVQISANIEQSHYSNEICKRLDNLTGELNEIKYLLRQNGR